MSSCVILGADSDIAKGLKPLLEADGWIIYNWQREVYQPVFPRWDLAIVAIGRVAPVGLWWTQNEHDWEQTFMSNVLLPIRLLRTMWTQRQEHAAVCFLAGSNPNEIDDGYSAYSTSKIALLKACEQLDHESQDAKFFALAPGIVLTKIHRQSNGWSNVKLAKAIKEGKSTPMERIYGCLKWCLSQPKSVIGGRNICVSDPWDKEEFLASRLAMHKNIYKIQRHEFPPMFPENEGT